MISSEREKLTNWPNLCLSLGITQDGSPRGTIPVPWESTGHAMNMRLPTIYISVNDLSNSEILDQLNAFNVIGLYVFDPLPDYSTLSRFTKAEDIYILNTVGVNDLSFARYIPWFMFYIEGASLQNLDDLFPGGREYAPHSYCLGLSNCHVTDVSAIARNGVLLSELLIWGENNKKERAKWLSVPAMKRRYYTE